MTSALGHLATREVAAPAQWAYRVLCDPVRLGRWSLGCFDTRFDDTSKLHTGLSLFDRSQGWFRLDEEPSRLLVDYWVGAPGALSRRISARVVAGDEVGYQPQTCLVMLTAWRPQAMPPERWERLCASHEAEIWLIKAQIEAEYRDSTDPQTKP